MRWREACFLGVTREINSAEVAIESQGGKTGRPGDREKKPFECREARDLKAQIIRGE